MIGTCDSCLKFPRILTTQTNFGVKRDMCKKCCEAANEVEKRMTLSPSQRHAGKIPSVGRKEQHRYFVEWKSVEAKLREAFEKWEEEKYD